CVLCVTAEARSSAEAASSTAEARSSAEAASSTAEARSSAEAASSTAEARSSASGAADDATAQLRVLLVQPDARGHSLGGRLVDTCVEHARSAGYRRMRLWTNDVLESARRIYLDRGFTLIEEEPHHSFGKDLVGQVYELRLAPGSLA